MECCSDRAEVILPALQEIADGDVLPALPGATDLFVIAAVREGEDLVLTVPGADGKVGVSWEFLLQPEGREATRPVVRARIAGGWPAIRNIRGARAEETDRVRVLAVRKDSARPMIRVALLSHGVTQARQLREV
jgi:hypothetical protein